MLEKVRKPKRARNIMAYIIFGAICLVFVFMGDIPNQFGLSSVGGPAALVNKEPISFVDFREAYARLESQYKGQLDFLPAAQRQMYLDNIKSQALEMLINSQVISQEAKNLGVIVSDEEIRDYIMKIPAFQEDEKFRRERYDNYLSYRKISPEKFESEVRKEVATTQLRSLVELALEPSRVSSEATRKLDVINANFEFARVSDDHLTDGFKLNENEIKAYVSNSENESAIKDYYMANKMNFEEEEKVRARHILVKFDSSKTGDKEQALAKIKEIQSKLGNEDFAKLAKEYSDDPGSKEKGGDLGFFGRGSMVPEFETVAFQSDLNTVSEPVETQFGYHLIKVEEKQEATTRSLEDASYQIAQEILTDKKKQAELEKLKSWVEGSDLKQINKWVSGKKIKWEDTGDFKLSANSIPKLSFKEEDLSKVLRFAANGEKLVRELIQVGKQHYIVRVKTFKEELPKKTMTSEFSADSDINKGRIASDIFNMWAEQVKETAQIDRNPQVLAR